MVVCLRKDYLKKAYKQLEDREVYEDVANDPSVLVNKTMKTVEKIPVPSGLSTDTLKHFPLKDPKFGMF